MTIFRANVLRMTVKTDEAEEFEQQARRQLEIVTTREMGTILYTFCRRAPGGSTILPAPPANMTEYIHLMAYADEAAQQLHLDIEHPKELPADGWAWGQVFRKYMQGPLYADRFQMGDITTGVTRQHSWSPSSMFRFAFHRFKIKEGMEEEFEKQARRQIAVVTEHEPGTVLYTFSKRAAEGSTLIARPQANKSEYLHLMAYLSEEAQQRHLMIEHPGRFPDATGFPRFDDGWTWGSVFPTFLDAPLENERFEADQLVTGVTRDIQWYS